MSDAIDITPSNTPNSIVNASRRLERKLGNSELAFYLPSRADGVNDMCLHIGFDAPARLVNESRVASVWAILRHRHPLLASVVEMRSYDDVRFVYERPKSVEDALSDARRAFVFTGDTRDELLDRVLNGPRTLSNTCQTYSYIANAGKKSPGSIEGAEEDLHWDICFCASHYLGDGISVHTLMNDFFTLLGSNGDLDALLHAEFPKHHEVLSAPLESGLPPVGNRFFQAAHQVDFMLDQTRLVGGHTMPRTNGKDRKITVRIEAYERERTQLILAKCKAHGVSISAALFAILNIAWARASPNTANPAMPTMMYSAMDLRPRLTKRPPTISPFYLAIGYFNVVLPSFVHADEEKMRKVFWLRAQSAKNQARNASTSPLLVERVRAMSIQRAERARKFAKQDDGIVEPPAAKTSSVKRVSVLPSREVAPSAALIGLSLMGNLDAIYKHKDFEAIKLRSHSSGLRVRPGGILFLSDTFAGRLEIDIAYDELGFDKALVNRFWHEIVQGIENFVVNSP